MKNIVVTVIKLSSCYQGAKVQGAARGHASGGFIRRGLVMSERANVTPNLREDEY